MVLQNFYGVLRIHVDRIVHLHLQDQVRSTLQIESQVDVIGQRRKQPIPDNPLGTPKIPNRKNNIVPMMNSSFQRRFLFIRMSSSLQVVA